MLYWHAIQGMIGTFSKTIIRPSIINEFECGMLNKNEYSMSENFKVDDLIGLD